MPLFEYELDEKSEAGSDFITRVNEELQRALFSEKRERKVSQQAIADKLNVNRSVVNRRFLGLENLTARTIAETLWAIGWEPFFEARKIVANDGKNDFEIKPPKVDTTGQKITLSSEGPRSPKISFSASST
jgi:hypothetical protein